MASVTVIWPLVIVPVLSNTTTSIRPDDSSAWWPLMKMPSCAPRPQAATSAAGVARPSAQGQAMISTASPALNARSAAAPASSQPAKVTTAAMSTSGTKTPDTRSASRWMAALSAWARPTSATRWASWVRSPTSTARTTRRPDRAMVPATTVSPAAASAGTDSPVIMLRSTADSPDSTWPSAAIFSPGRTTNTSPRRSRPTGTRRSVPSAPSTQTSLAAAAASFAIACPAELRARAS